jgi:hypothetical protein
MPAMSTTCFIHNHEHLLTSLDIDGAGPYQMYSAVDLKPMLRMKLIPTSTCKAVKISKATVALVFRSTTSACLGWHFTGDRYLPYMAYLFIGFKLTVD